MFKTQVEPRAASEWFHCRVLNILWRHFYYNDYTWKIIRGIGFIFRSEIVKTKRAHESRNFHGLFESILSSTIALNQSARENSDSYCENVNWRLGLSQMCKHLNSVHHLKSSGNEVRFVNPISYLPVSFSDLDSWFPLSYFAFSACQAGWVEYGSSCYFIDNKLTKKWSVARDICLNLEGDLPIIKSVGENEFIFELAKKQDNVAGLYIFGLWIGLKRKNGGEFYWVDDTPLGQRYQAWVPGEPNKPDIEHCGHMYVQGANQQKWNDIRCDLDSSKDYNNMGMIVLCQKKL